MHAAPVGRLALLLFALPALGLAVQLLTGCSNPGHPLIEQKCGTCHSAEIVYRHRYPEERWRQVIHGMKAVGLKLTAGEEEEILRILVRDYSPN